ncbi:MAG: trypsin-like peptidase domain-containing protein [Treponema sp.]|nr:trypsin-like peptidase domain-containing protein [Treponema sp.]MCL2272618.1 trypsin-like peptidase domain-containing protein [Treponema sp.]
MKPKKIIFKKRIYAAVSMLIVFLFFTFSCESLGGKNNFSSSRSTSLIRLDDIKKQINDKPVDALSQINIYRDVYSASNKIDIDDWNKLSQYEEEAIRNLIGRQEKAIEDENWEEVLSLGRSINNLGIATPNSGKEHVFMLADAKKKVTEGDNLGGFLAALKSHEIQPMNFADALFFLEKAAEAKQRRTASFFYSAAVSASAGNISSALREYATGRDSVADMIKGVATVIVDKGMRVERGMGMSDRVLGSAFFVDSSGLLITNYHVIESEVNTKYKGYSRLFIRMGDATSPRVPAKVIGWDKSLDLALIKTEIETEYVFSVVDRIVPKIGDTVLAIGSPVGLEKTVTSGIVSAYGRRILQVGDVIQIDAAVNQGNSGGPVIDSEGRLVGVVYAGSPYYQGLNFAIRAERLAMALPAMIKGGKAQRPWLGFTLCETFSGAEIIYSAPVTPAAMHQVSEGSFIRTINGRTISASQGGLIFALQEAIFLCGPGELIALETINLDGEIKKRIMMTAARPDLPMLEAAKVDRREKIAAPLFGMMLTPIQSGLFSANFRVNRVIRGSIADEAGISVEDPLNIKRLRLFEDEGYAVLEISVKKRRMGYLETNMQLPVHLDSPDTL